MGERIHIPKDVLLSYPPALHGGRPRASGTGTFGEDMRVAHAPEGRTIAPRDSCSFLFPDGSRASSYRYDQSPLFGRSADGRASRESRRWPEIDF